jgi:hypothetical protein
MSLIIKKNTTFKIPRTPPISFLGLALWLKADAGVSRSSFNYISEIEIAGTSSPNLNGTYTAIPPTSESSSYGFTGPSNGFSMGWNQSEERFELFSDEYSERGFISVDGINWNIYNSFLYQLDINGGSGGGSVGTYTWNDNEEAYYHSSGAFDIQGTDLRDVDTNELISQNFQPDYQGEWSNNGGDTENRVFIPAGSISGSVTTSTANTDHVTAWADQSGNGNNATPVADNPIYNISDLNSKPTISLTSMSDYVERVFSISINPLGVAGSTAFSVQYVEDVCDVGDDNGAMLGNFGGSATQTHYPYGLDCLVYDAFATTSRKVELTPPTAITATWSIYSVHSTNGEWKDYVNGALMYSDSDNTYDNSIGGDDTTLYIGKQTGLGNFSLKGKVAEVIVYNRVLTTPERQQVEAYLNSKYEIY